MPSVLEQPRLSHPALSALPATTGISLIVLTQLLKAPADQPNLPTVIGNAVSSLRALQARQPQIVCLLSHLTASLSVVAANLAELREFDQPVAMVGRVSAHRPWALLSTNLDRAPTALIESIGFGVACAYLTEEPFTNRVAADLYQLAQKHLAQGLSQVELDGLENYVLAQAHRSADLFADRMAGLDTTTAATNARFVTSITSQMSSLKVEQCRAAGRIQEMPDMELMTCALLIKNRAQAGDLQALQVAVAFCIGVPFELSKAVPFFTGTHCPSIVWIDPVRQCICVDMERALAGLSKRQTGQHLATTLILNRPLPAFMGSLIHAACAANSGLQTVGDITGSTSVNSRSHLPGADPASAIRASIARFIASRAGVALRAGLPRHRAAYATLSLYLISKSDHPYINTPGADIREACERIYQSIGWGHCAPHTGPEGKSFGSRMTPEIRWVKRVIEVHANAAMVRRPSKRYGTESLICHQNAFANYTGLLFTMLTGSRHRKKLEFCASAWQQYGVFEQVADKPCSPTLGLTPMPIPTTLVQQITLWRVHLSLLDRRLAKLEFSAAHPFRARIHAVLKGEATPLLFSMGGRGMTEDLLTVNIFAGVGGGMNADFSRHLMPGLLDQLGVPFEYIQCWLRHHVAGTAASSITSGTVQHAWLSQVANRLDRIALDLGLCALHGIARKV